MTWPTFDGVSASYENTDLSWTDALTCSPPPGATSAEEQALAVAIPQDAAAGTSYRFQLETCDASISLCSNSDSDVILTVAGSNWSEVPYTSDFSTLTQAKQSSGGPLDVTFDGSDDVLDSSESSEAIGIVKPGGLAIGQYTDTYDAQHDPFAIDRGTDSRMETVIRQRVGGTCHLRQRACLVDRRRSLVLRLHGY